MHSMCAETRANSASAGFLLAALLDAQRLYRRSQRDDVGPEAIAPPHERYHAVEEVPQVGPGPSRPEGNVRPRGRASDTTSGCGAPADPSRCRGRLWQHLGHRREDRMRTENPGTGEGSTMREALVAVVILLLLQAGGAPVGAQEIRPTLEKIRETGVIQLGFRETSPPFSFLDKDRKPTGYVVDLCLQV
jgi:hypothetical protein